MYVMLLCFAFIFILSFHVVIRLLSFLGREKTEIYNIILKYQSFCLSKALVRLKI